LEKATPEKLRLEEKQRLARKTRKEQGREWENMWFGQREQGVTQVKAIQDGDIEPSWVYNGRYWEARERQAWENCPDIM
jgi:transposase